MLVCASARMQGPLPLCACAHGNCCAKGDRRNICLPLLRLTHVLLQNKSHGCCKWPFAWQLSCDGCSNSTLSGAAFAAACGERTWAFESLRFSTLPAVATLTPHPQACSHIGTLVFASMIQAPGWVA